MRKTLTAALLIFVMTPLLAAAGPTSPLDSVRIGPEVEPVGLKIGPEVEPVGLKIGPEVEPVGEGPDR